MRTKRLRLKTDTSDDVHVDLARRGDTEAFEKLYVKHASNLRAAALRLTGSHHMADEVCQIAWIKAWKNLPRFKGHSSFNTWLNVIMRYGFYSIIEKRNCLRIIDESQLMPDSEDGGLAELAIDLEPTPAEMCARVETARLVRGAIRNLPDFCRDVARLHLEGHEHHRIAKTLDVAIGTSLSRLHNAKRRLATVLADRLNGEPADQFL
ncbi:MAG TPA: RNA polymerase sigma factor [Candidatus Paceibacterota bacterium]